MAYATTNTASFGAGLSARINAFVADFRANRARRAEYRRTIAELETMSDRELDDLGISRFDLPQIAAEHVGK